MAHGVFIQLWLLSGPAASLLNVAPSGTASQSSLHSWPNGRASNAIDGNKDPEFFHGSCTHTEMNSVVHWWSLRLPAVYRISHISITNRNFAAYKLNNAEILIGNSFENNGNNNPRCVVIPSIPSGGTTSFECGWMIGRFVNVYLNSKDPDGTLTLCEVEVYGELAAPSPSFNAEVMGRNITVVKSKLCWSDALFYCRDFYWDLLSIHSEEEQSKVEEVLRNAAPVTKHVWMGLRRYLMAGTWFWMSGASVNYTRNKMASIWQTTSHCGGMDTSSHFHWTDYPCDDHVNFICSTDWQANDGRVEFFSSTRPGFI